MEPMHKINKVEVRNLQIEDYAQLSHCLLYTSDAIV